MNIGLYFGAFNPIHDGHLQVAIYAVNNSDLDKVWFVLTPQSPHKIDSTLIDFNHRYKMLEIVCKKHKNILPSDIEKNLPKPSYSISTLNYLKKENDINNYSLIIGDDNIKKLTTWKQYSEIIKNHNPIKNTNIKPVNDKLFRFSLYINGIIVSGSNINV